MLVLYKGKLYEEEGSFGPNTSADIAQMPANLGLYSRFGYLGKKVNIYSPKKKHKKKYFETISASINEVIAEVESKKDSDVEDTNSLKKNVKEGGNLGVGHSANFGGGPHTTKIGKHSLNILRVLNRYRKGE